LVSLRDGRFPECRGLSTEEASARVIELQASARGQRALPFMRPTDDHLVSLGNHVINHVPQIRKGRAQPTVELLLLEADRTRRRFRPDEKHLVTNELRCDDFVNHAKIPFTEDLRVQAEDERLILLG
jgi:hypothetical protein